MKTSLLTSLVILAFGHPVWCQTITTVEELAVHINSATPTTGIGRSNGTLQFRDGTTGTYSQRIDATPGFTNPHTTSSGELNTLTRNLRQLDFPLTYTGSTLSLNSTNLSFYQGLYGPGVTSAVVTDSSFTFGGINTELWSAAVVSFRFTDQNGDVIPQDNLDVTFVGDLQGIGATASLNAGYDFDFTFANMVAGNTGDMIVKWQDDPNNPAAAQKFLAGASVRMFRGESADPNDSQYDQMSVSFNRTVEITAIPEPSSTILGAAGLIFLFRRRSCR